jgi:hypothetical protein
MSIYLNNPWKPVKHTIIKSKETTDTIHDLGYQVSPFLDESALNELRQLYDKTHQIDDKKGGMFYSVYSRDLEYRKKVHDEIGRIIQPSLDKYLQDYKVIINSFVIKAPGPKSEFHLHADTTGLDERKHSALNVWIPLIDVDKDNGALALVPESHKFFTPYRSISFPAPFDHIQSTVKKYLEIIPVKAGEALIFDNRMLHNSPPNTSNETRVAIVCGLFPKDVSMMTCHKAEYKLGGDVELIEHDDDFLLTYPKFLLDCQDRPESGKSLGFVSDDYNEISSEEFQELCTMHNVKEKNQMSIDSTDCNLIEEPIHIVADIPEVEEKIEEKELVFDQPKSTLDKIVSRIKQLYK